MAGEVVQIILRNNYFYSGEILEEDATFIKLKDRKGQIVRLNKTDIQAIKEVAF